jgi:hypothetical protein
VIDVEIESTLISLCKGGLQRRGKLLKSVSCAFVLGSLRSQTSPHRVTELTRKISDLLQVPVEGGLICD